MYNHHNPPDFEYDNLKAFERLVDKSKAFALWCKFVQAAEKESLKVPFGEWEQKLMGVFEERVNETAQGRSGSE